MGKETEHFSDLVMLLLMGLALPSAPHFAPLPPSICLALK